MGAACIMIVPSFWLMGYCLAVFQSMAFLKRHVEVTRVDPGQDHLWAARGYLPGERTLPDGRRSWRCQRECAGVCAVLA